MHLLELVLITGLILLGFSLLQHLSNKTLFPYTILLLIFGLCSKEILEAVGFHGHLDLSSDVIFYFLLPLLLFGAALHLNFHQFRIQFKTITFISTFGLLLSVGVVGALVSLLLGIPLGVSILFGTLISATDPIAVLALFKSLGGPKRLALIADGESMFNDATAVVLFRIISAIVVGGTSLTHLTIVESGLEFIYVFFGSILFGAMFGYLISSVLSKIDNDIAIETTITLGASLLAFTASEHYFHLSGVITAVVAGLFVGNLGRSRISAQVIHFVHEFWDYIGYLAVSAVFFFATFNLDINFLISDFPRWFYAVIAVLIGRAISVYVSIFITNKSSLFLDEPNIPLSWQHILNWGGLRGVIPLVLVFSLPESFVYKSELFLFTFASLLFTLFINGSTIGFLLKKLKLNNPSSSEKLSKVLEKLFNLQLAIKLLQKNGSIGIGKKNLNKKVESWNNLQDQLIGDLNENISQKEFNEAIHLQTLFIERTTYEKLLRKEEISEAVFFQLDAQLDLQADSWEYPITNIRNIGKGGKINSSKLYRQKLFLIRQKASKFSLFKKVWHLQENDLQLERFMIVRARIIGSLKTLEYLEQLLNLLNNKDSKKIILELTMEYKKLNAKNRLELKSLKRKFNVSIYEEKVLSNLLVHHQSPWTI